MSALPSILDHNALLAARGRAVVAGLACPGPYALVDYPDYANAGDVAIWLGTLAVLEKVFGAPPSYSATMKEFRPDACLRATRGGTVFLLGGGSFGDLSLKHHLRRLDALAALTDRPVVLLPFSIAWSDSRDPDLVARSRAAVRAHPNLRLLARETLTRDALQRDLGCESILCPDLAHALPGVAPIPPAVPVVVLARKDQESAEPSSPAVLADFEVSDWRDSAALLRCNRLGKWRLRFTRAGRRLAVQRSIATEKGRIALSILARGETVITDRLHGHILATVLGRRQWIVNNKTGKVRAYVETWSAGCPEIRLAGSLAEAARRCRERA